MAASDSLTGDDIGRQPTGSRPASFETLITDTADRFGLGSRAGPLVREVLNMITGTPGGVAGFIDKFESAGLGPELSSWLGRRDAPSMSQQTLDRMVGPAAIDGIASRVGASSSSTSSAVAYLLPKMIGVLTPGGTVPSSPALEGRRPAEHDQPEADDGRVVEHSAPGQAGARYQEQFPPRPGEAIHDQPYMMRWLWPLLVALAVLGLGSYLFSANRPAQPPPVVGKAPALPRPAEAPSLPARLALSNDNGMVNFSGAVHDTESRTAIINALKSTFGPDKVQGDIAIDLNRGAAPWLVNLRTALGSLKVPGVQVIFDGSSVDLGGLINDADRDRIANSLRSTLGGGLVFGSLSDRIGNFAASANNKVLNALSSLKPGFTANDLVAILNQSVINFPTGGAEVPGSAMAPLQSAATQIKQLPPSTVIEVSGHTDNTGDQAANVKLSQERADAVRNVLVQAGVEASKLVAKGYGSANPIASNDLLEGRFRNRRIEYRVLRP